MDSVKFNELTVEELIKVLGNYPANTKVTCCGIDYLWLNHNAEDGYLTIDTENMAEWE